MTYPIHELFHTWQGEGVHMGRPAFFVRTFGCPVRCPYCDSAGTWHAEWVPKDVRKMTEGAIALEAGASGAKTVVVTGGEPTIFDLDPMVGALHGAGLRAHLETSGGYGIPQYVDWITLSPKRWKMPLMGNVKRANEFKLIIQDPSDIPFYWNFIFGAGAQSGVSVWLHPEWSQRENPVVLNAISEAVKKGDRPFRAGWQLHKLYKVDSLDSRSRPLVPLGGVRSQGF